MNADLETCVRESLADRQLLEHPFYRRWEAGELSREELTRYAEQYRHFEAMMPDFLAALADHLDPGIARDFVEANLRDEVTPPSHLELFDRFAAAYGATDTPPSPAMEALLSAYREVAECGPVSALAGLLAYESQGAAVADSKGAGLAQHYRAPHGALDFWIQHSSIEGDHAQWTLDALDSLEGNLDVVRSAARTIAEAWWGFLDERELLAA
jgi:pyrroloquinoline-quinone synthase